MNRVRNERVSMLLYTCLFHNPEYPANQTVMTLVCRGGSKIYLTLVKKIKMVPSEFLTQIFNPNFEGSDSAILPKTGYYHIFVVSADLTTRKVGLPLLVCLYMFFMYT